ncbi:hypothetical protein JTE90_010282 [Oedothorax gibbosus]|uniref:Glucose-methanol-choline oxidoreductase N-terminal domain-containing protein n=1 Tax=Oedothorax gibbosus TaxID=931172 RepID=A0AAV6V559_9ARAC|nr:hypothetical protein JTE90_010282 [Oedothorax gibbosus]
MLSGIGPKEHLESLYIPVEQDLPVGNNLQDHVAVPIPFQNRTGVLTSNEATYLLAFLNGQIRPEIDFPDFELYFVEVPPIFARRQFGIKPEVYRQVYGPYDNSTMFMCFASPIHPRSRGTVRLQSANPYDPPLIDPQLLC